MPSSSGSFRDVALCRFFRSACTVSVCAPSAYLVSPCTCTVSAYPLSPWIGSPCIINACTLSACTLSSYPVSACTVSASPVSTCTVSACAISACVGRACAVSKSAVPSAPTQVFRLTIPPKNVRALNRGKNQGMIDDHVTECIDRGEEYFGACLKRRGNQNDIVLPHLYENESA